MLLGVKHFKKLLFVCSGAALVFLLFYVEFFSSEDWIVYEAHCDANYTDHDSGDHHYYNAGRNGNRPGRWSLGRFRRESAGDESADGTSTSSSSSRSGGGGGGGGGGSKPPKVVSNSTMTYHFDLYRIRVEGCCCPPLANRTALPLCCSDCERDVPYTECTDDFCGSLSVLGILTVIAAFSIVLFGLLSLLFTFARLRLIHQKDIFFPVRGLFWGLAAVLSCAVWFAWRFTGDRRAKEYLDSCQFPGSYTIRDSFHTSQNSSIFIFAFCFSFFMAIVNQLFATRPKYVLIEMQDHSVSNKSDLNARLIIDVPDVKSTHDVDGEQVEYVGEDVDTKGG